MLQFHASGVGTRQPERFTFTAFCISDLVNRVTESVYDETQLLAMSTPKVQKLIEVLKSYAPKVKVIDYW